MTEEARRAGRSDQRDEMFDSNGRYVLLPVCVEKRAKCGLRFENNEKAIEELKQGQKSIDRKVSATLIFALVTMATIILKLVFP